MTFCKICGFRTLASKHYTLEVISIGLNPKTYRMVCTGYRALNNRIQSTSYSYMCNSAQKFHCDICNAIYDGDRVYFKFNNSWWWSIIFKDKEKVCELCANIYLAWPTFELTMNNEPFYGE